MDSKYNCVMVTGGCGAIGSCVLNILTMKYQTIRFVNVDKLTYCANVNNICKRDNYVLYRCDICDYASLLGIFEAECPDLVIHLAAETHVDKSFKEPMHFIKTNVIGTQNVLECVKECNHFVKRVIFMSTDEVYGSVDHGIKCKEDAPLAPSNPYSASKAAAEMICQSFKSSFKLPIIIARCNNVISPYQYFEKLIPLCVRHIRDGMCIPVHGRGGAKRNFIHGNDVANAIDVLSVNGLIGNVYNIGSDMEYSVIEVVQSIINIMCPGESYKEWVIYCDDKFFQDDRYSVDSSALRALGWQDNISFKEALFDIINSNNLVLF